MIDGDGLANSFRALASERLSPFAVSLSSQCEPDPPNGRIFLAEVTASHDLGAIRVIFGDREFEVRSSVHPHGRPWPLDIGFYLDAIGADDPRESGSMWCHDVQRLTRIVEEHVGIVQLCLQAISQDPVGIWRQAEEARQSSIRESAESLKDRSVRVTVGRANDAFRAGDFRAVVELLAPLEADLSEAQRGKLRLARARLGDDSGVNEKGDR